MAADVEERHSCSNFMDRSLHLMIQAAGMTRARISWGFPQTRRSTVARRFPFDLYIPAENAEYEGLIKVQGIARLGSGWSWTQNDVIP